MLRKFRGSTRRESVSTALTHFTLRVSMFCLLFRPSAVNRSNLKNVFSVISSRSEQFFHVEMKTKDSTSTCSKKEPESTKIKEQKL